jgi:hypothetical protein
MIKRSTTVQLGQGVLPLTARVFAELAVIKF